MFHKQQSPTQLYDIRGVFDGPIIKDGWNGFPTIFYTSVSFGPLGWHSQPPESEGVETQSLAYTEDDGETWTKLNFGGNGNPVICESQQITHTTNRFALTYIKIE